MLHTSNQCQSKKRGTCSNVVVDVVNVVVIAASFDWHILIEKANQFKTAETKTGHLRPISFEAC